DGALEASPWVGLGVVAAAAFNGIAIVRAYFMLFTGARRLSTVSLKAGRREWAAVVTLTALILGEGLFPQFALSSRHRAAVDILTQREERARAASDVARDADGTPAAAAVRLAGPDQAPGGR